MAVRKAGDEEVLKLLREDRHGGLKGLSDDDLGLSDEGLYYDRQEYDPRELQEHLEGSVFPYAPLYPASREAEQLAYEADVKMRLAELAQRFPQELPHRLIEMALK